MASTGTITFTAADGTNINTLGFTNDYGTPTVQTNQCSIITDDAAHIRSRYTATAMETNNHYVQCEFVSGIIRLTARQASATNTKYTLKMLDEFQGNVDLCVVSAGTTTVLDFWDRNTAPGQTFKLEVTGSDQNGYHEGILQVNASDTTITTGLFCGLDATIYTSGVLDDWIAEDLAAGGVIGSRFMKSNLWPTVELFKGSNL